MKQYLSAKEAAAELGIQVPTLYAYVSRGLLRSEAADGKTRARRYLRKDVTALKQRKEMRRDPSKAVESALHFGAPVLESGITLIENGRFYYRGHDVIHLAQTRSFAEVVSLIWTGDFDANVLQTDPFVLPPLPDLPAFEAFQAVLPLAAAPDFAAYDLSATAVTQTGARILQVITAVFAQKTVTTSQPIPQQLQQALAARDDAAADLFNAALILCADHELNISSFTARCVASAGSTPYAVVNAGLSALQGYKHGGYTERVEALFQEAGLPENVARTLASRLRRGVEIPGFGHTLYPEGDPRGAALLAMIETVYPESKGLLLARALETAVFHSIGLKPTIDFGLAALTYTLDLPSGSALALFALGRMAGWIGHALEQYHVDQLIRPRARYIGTLPL
ncbi:MAG: citrate synthase family protein [Anaerolineae bacterium]|nr:citrate synthase family protein [Anaerolineae bacterium]